MDQAQTLSATLLDLYARCNDLPMSRFLSHALGEVRRCLPFDSAWWGMSGIAGGVHLVHASYTDGLPAETPRLWAEVRDEDVVSQAMLAQPGRSLCFAAHQMDSTEGSRWLSRRIGHRNVLCTQTTDTQLDQQVFLCLGRSDERACFSEAERRFKELLMPHLLAVLKLNRAAHLRQLRQQGTDRYQQRAVVDRRGALQSAEPGFVEQLCAAWPRWQGPLLPLELRSALETATTGCTLKNLHVELSWLGDLALLSLRPVSPLERLSPRERAVAEAFAAGLSYKEVAQQLSMAPTTTRHHLRNIYAKLEVDSKTAIAQLFGDAASAVH